jgi:alpha-galactosidase
MGKRMGRKVLLTAGVAILLLPGCILALQDGAARTPPMGFSTWNYFGCGGNNQTNVMSVAKSLVQVWPANWEGKSISLKDVGYQYINLDDCWEGSRAANNVPQCNASNFPNGFKWLCDTIHSLGLKMGIYSDCGTETCAGHFAELMNNAQYTTQNYDSIDVATYIQWGFDYLKLDWCNIPSQWSSQQGCQTLYSQMGHWLDKNDTLQHATSGVWHKIVFSMCQWGDYNVASWADSCGHLWRTTGDIGPGGGCATWQSGTASSGGVWNNWYTNLSNAQYEHPGAWNDPDMLEVGQCGLTDVQSQSHFDMWCNSGAPLLMGNNTVTMSQQTFTTLSNREVIAIDQDSLGYQGRLVRTSGNIYVQVKKLLVHAADTVHNKKYAVMVLNNNGSAAAGDIKWSDIGQTNTAQFRVRNLWLHRWLKSNNIIDTATPPDTTTTITDSLYVASIPSDGTVHVLMEMGNPDGNGVSVLPQDNAAIAAQLGSRMSVRGNEIFIPLARSTVQIFNVQGREIASLSASQSGWYPFAAGRGIVSGACLVRLNTPAGSVSRVMTFVR